MNFKLICLVLFTLHALHLSLANGQQPVSTVVGDKAAEQLKLQVNSPLAPQFVARLAQQNERREAAILATQQAVDFIDGSPYATADRTLARMNEKLIRKGLSTAEAGRLTHSHNRGNNRELKNLVGRWVEINGIPYQIMSLRASVHLVGAEEIIVRETTGFELPVTPEQVDYLRILPFFYDASMDYVPATGGGDYRHYGAPRRSVYLPEDDWKYQLVYDATTSLWTDGKSAAGHRWWAHAYRLWADLQNNP